MTHPIPESARSAVVFVEWLGVTCSICAPWIMDQKEVEAFAELNCERMGAPWTAVDKSKPPLSMGEPTPNPCNVYPSRRHWFLLSDIG
jgi:hypothetical protein